MKVMRRDDRPKVISLKKAYKILEKVKRHIIDVSKLSDKRLVAKTAIFKKRLGEGESLDSLLPEAYAVACEADRRVLGMMPYDVQIIGAIALHYGMLAEMNTGEGKTLVATMPLYLNALTGKSTFLMTSNDYLAYRDAKEMGKVYTFLGLTIMPGVPENPGEQFTNEEKKKIYAADIVYTTHSAFGFDYLFNNLAKSLEERFMRDFYYVIIDEADLVLLDAAQMPLVIAGSPRVQSNLYTTADFFVKTLVEGEDYTKEDKCVWLTDKGVERAETFYKIENFYSRENFEINRHVTLALRANSLYELTKDYVVTEKDGIVLLDVSTGRMTPGVKMRGGQHQALEAKEGIKITQETRSVASITYQNLFRMFPKMAGMSGTISDAKEELRDVYGSSMMVIPTNKPRKRKDLRTVYCHDSVTQYSEAIKAAMRAHKKGRPVLIIVSSIGETEIVSRLLIEQKIPHNVLNATNAYWEASIIKEAGQRDAVTVATSMAGRGTDIKLGDGVAELGGLAVIGIGRMNNTRQERQAIGRAGRQGDPGTSRFYVSLEDDIITDDIAEKFEKYISGKKQLSEKKIKKLIDGAQVASEEKAVSSRRNSVEYDKVLQKQREIIYATRDQLINGGNISVGRIMNIASGNIDRLLKKKISRHTLIRYILDNIASHIDQSIDEINLKNKKEIKEYLMKLIEEGYEKQIVQLDSARLQAEFIRKSILTALDDEWVEQVDYLQQLQYAMSGRSHASRNPIYEYQIEARASFEDMEQAVHTNTIRNLLLSHVEVVKEVAEDGSICERLDILYP